MSLLESIFYMMWRGLAIGVLISAPMGPVGILCIQRTLDKGRKAGFYTGIGAALSDLFYCLLTGFGLSFIEDTLEKNSSIIQLVGSMVLIAFSVYLFRKNPTKQLKRPVEADVSAKKSVLGGFLFTFSNPLILFLIIGLFARFNFLLQEMTIGHYFVGYLFIIAGALGWWWIVTYFIDKVRAHFNLRSMWLINKIIGGVILIFAIVGIVSAIMDLTGGSESKAESYYPGRVVIGRKQSESESGKFSRERCHLIPLREDGKRVTDFAQRIKMEESGVGGWSWTPSNGKDLLSPNFVIKPVEIDDGVSTVPGIEVVAEISDDNNECLRKFTTKVPIGRNLHPKVNYYEILHDDKGWQFSAGYYSLEPILSFVDSETYGKKGVSETKLQKLGKGELLILDVQNLTEYNSVAYMPEADFRRDIMEDIGEDLTGNPLEETGSGGEIWKVLDRTLDEDQLRMGGDYELLIRPRADSPEDYDIYYYSGAWKNNDEWSRGDKKGELLSTGIPGVWNLRWYASDRKLLEKDLKARRSESDIIELLFPYQSSTLRLQRLKKREQ
ncbi:MAG: LysE family translocator [Muribaculaceae bacterium]|nr:LysE family translocator [Muribaculaceae bacterium]